MVVDDGQPVRIRRPRQFETIRPGGRSGYVAAVRSTLPEESSFRCVITYLGAYAYWDLPSEEIDVIENIETVENHIVKEKELPVIDRENDPPILSV